MIATTGNEGLAQDSWWSGLHGVVDASLAAKWFIPEQATAQSAALLDRLMRRDFPNGDRGFVVPEVFFAEVVSAVSKQSRNPALLLQCTAMLDQLPVERVEWSRLPKERCIELIRSRVGAYDAVYAAIALDRQVPLITSDARLARALGEPAWVVVFP